MEFDPTNLREYELRVAVGILLVHEPVVSRQLVRSLLPRGISQKGKKNPVSRLYLDTLRDLEKVGLIRRGETTIEVVVGPDILLSAVKASLTSPQNAGFARETLNRWRQLRRWRHPIWNEIRRHADLLLQPEKPRPADTC